MSTINGGFYTIYAEPHLLTKFARKVQALPPGHGRYVEHFATGACQVVLGYNTKPTPAISIIVRGEAATYASIMLFGLDIMRFTSGVLPPCDPLAITLWCYRAPPRQNGTVPKYDATVLRDKESKVLFIFTYGGAGDSSCWANLATACETGGSATYAMGSHPGAKSIEVSDGVARFGIMGTDGPVIQVRLVAVGCSKAFRRTALAALDFAALAANA